MAYSVYDDALKSGKSTYRPIGADSQQTSKPSESVIPAAKIQPISLPGAGQFLGSSIGETIRKGAIGGLGILKGLFHAPIEAATTIQRMFNTPTINKSLLRRADQISAATQSLDKNSPTYVQDVEVIKAANSKLQEDVKKQTNPLINTSPTKFLGQIGETALMALPVGELNAIRGSTLFGKGISASGRLKAALPLVGRGAAIGAGFGAAQTAQEDSPNLKSLAKNVGLNAAIGAGAELAAPLLFKRFGGKVAKPTTINPPIDPRVRNQFQNNLTAQLEVKNPEAARIISETNFDDAISSVDLAKKAFDALPDNLRQNDSVKQAVTNWAKSAEQTVGFVEHGVGADDAIGALSKELPTAMPPKTTQPQSGTVLQRIFSEKSFEPQFLQGMKSREARTILDSVETKSKKLKTIEDEIKSLEKSKLNERLQEPALQPETATSGLKFSLKVDKKPLGKTNGLIEEAQKYKSAEDFVKAKQKDMVYHGSGKPLDEFDERGAFFSDDMMNAEGYAGGENVYEGFLDLKKPLIIDAKGRHHSDLITKYGKTTQEVVGNVDKEKYDGVIFKNINDSFADDVEGVGTDTIYYPFNAKKSFINESQLTDIWNEAKNIQQKVSTKGDTIYAQPKSLLKAINSRYPQDSAQISKLEKLIETRTKISDSLKEEIEQLKNSTSYKNMAKAKELKIPDFQDVVSTRNVVVDPEDALDLMKVQDLKPREVGYLTTIDPIRAAEKGDKSLRGILKKRFIEPLMAARDRQMTEFQKIKNTFDTLADEAGVRPVKGLAKMLGLQKDRTERNAMIFQAAEGRLENAEKILTAPEKRLIEYTRNKYDELLDRINAARSKVNLEPVKKRKEYITHIQALNFLESIGRDVTKMSDNELLQFVDRKSPAFKFAKERLGGPFEEDLTQAFNAYLEPALRQIHFTEVGNSILADAKFLPQNQQKYWKDFVRERVFGSMDDLSAYANKVIHPSFSRVTQALRRITGRGAILGNIQTIALQPSSIAQVYGTAGGKALLRSTPKMLSRQGTEFVEKFSAIYRQRAQELDINPSTLNKAQNVLNYANKELDQFMVKTAWLSAYEQGTRQFGLSHQAAVRYAENVAGKTQAIYDKMFASRMAGSKVGGVLAQFQTYSFNLWNQLTRDLKVTAKTFDSKKPALVQAMRLGVGMFAVNQLYKGAGLQSPFDLPGLDTEKYGKERKKGVGIIPAAVHSASIGTMLPYSGTAKYGAPISIDLLYNLFKLPIVMSDDAERTKTLNELAKVVPMLVPGGNQIRKTVEGLQAVIDGYTKVGNKKIPIKGTSEEIRAILFGKYGTKAARDYFDKQ